MFTAGNAKGVNPKDASITLRNFTRINLYYMASPKCGGHANYLRLPAHHDVTLRLEPSRSACFSIFYLPHPETQVSQLSVAVDGKGKLSSKFEDMSDEFSFTEAMRKGMTEYKLNIKRQ